MGDIKKIRPGSYILHKDEPYIVKLNQIVVTGTHSHAKNKLELEGLFSGKKDRLVLSPHEKLEELEIIKKLGQLISKTNDKIQIMDMNTYETLDAEVDEEMNEELTEGNQVTFIEFNGRIRILEKR